jgi:pimeloyl-ACP methyl ester carboxylesterase
MMKMTKRLIWAIPLGISSALLLLIVGLSVWPMKQMVLEAEIQPAGNFQEALRLIEDLQAQIPAEVRPECRGMVLHHGRSTKRVYVLMHGLTNCPAQFKSFGRLLFEGGANVVIPRLPYHGLSEGLDMKQVFITAENMIDVAQLAVNLAHGLGEEVCVVGLSVNGTVAAWLAQNRPDLHAVMVIAPFLAPSGLPDWAIAPLTRFIGLMPNKLVWWDSTLRDTLEGPEHAYRRFASHSLAWVMAIGLNAFCSSMTSAPGAGHIIMVNSASDFAISLPRAEALAQNWKSTAPDKVTNFIFSADLEVPHDSIDPAQPNARTDIVYPELLRLLDAAGAPPEIP